MEGYTNSAIYQSLLTYVKADESGASIEEIILSWMEGVDAQAWFNSKSSTMVSLHESHTQNITELVANFNDNNASITIINDTIADDKSAWSESSVMNEVTVGGTTAISGWRSVAGVAGGAPISNFSIYADKFEIVDSATGVNGGSPFRVEGGATYMGAHMADVGVTKWLPQDVNFPQKRSRGMGFLLDDTRKADDL